MIPLCINGKDYYDREEALAAWFEEWLMKQDFEQDLILLIESWSLNIERLILIGTLLM
jgi:hypothetical protein